VKGGEKENGSGVDYCVGRKNGGQRNKVGMVWVPTMKALWAIVFVSWP